MAGLSLGLSLGLTPNKGGGGSDLTFAFTFNGLAFTFGSALYTYGAA